MAIDALDLTETRIVIGETIEFVNKNNLLQSKLEGWSGQLNAESTLINGYKIQAEYWAGQAQSFGDITVKADKVTGAVENNLAGLDANGNLIGSNISENDLITGMIINGVAAGYGFSILTGTPSKPLVVLFTKASVIYKLIITWGTSGGADGNETEFIVSKSINSGANYTLFTTLTITYDAAGDATNQTWA
ncbi:MAG: hypothetical protein QM479_16065 [Pseudomonadota bacterium]